MAGVRQFDEGEMLAEALGVFWRKGLRATTMQDIAQATGVLRGSLYNAYGGKDEIFLLAFDAYVGRFLAAIRQALESTPDPGQGLRALFDAAIASMTSGSPARGCLSTRTATEAPLDDPRLQARLRGMLDELRRIVLAALSTDAARARLAVTPDEAADLVVTFTRGLAVMERVYQDAGHLERIAGALVRVLLPDQRRRPVQSGTKTTSTQ